ncbi:glycoside hydrolase family 20 zincin-like fold domain-containing protein [Myxococcota bacterium]
MTTFSGDSCLDLSSNRAMDIGMVARFVLLTFSAGCVGHIVDGGNPLVPQDDREASRGDERTSGDPTRDPGDGLATWVFPTPDLVPMPKEYQQTGYRFELDGQPIFIEEGNRQCEIAADEIVLRIEEQGGSPGTIQPVSDVTLPGIYVLPITSTAGIALATAQSSEITTKDPGPQGYVLKTTSDQLVILGSDNIGTLYGAMTLRQMMVPDGGSVSIAAANVYDKPDYHYRGRMGFHRGLARWGYEAADIKAGIDVMMRFKINILSDYLIWLDPREVGTDTREFYRAMNQYALERGIHSMRGEEQTAVGTTYDNDQPEFQNWDCVHHQDQKFWCWSRDDMARERANRLLDLTRDAGFTMFLLHPVDGGAEVDPEVWSYRCELCQNRWGDDRALASVHQFNLWREVMEEKGLEDVIYTIPIYPYWAGPAYYYADCSEWEELELCLQLRRNTLEYWEKLVEYGLNPSVIPMIWMERPEWVEPYREIFAGRPLAVYAHSIRVLGYFGTWHRKNITNYVGDPRDIFLLTGGFLEPKLTWMNQLCSVEFTWNTSAPGSEVYNGLRYDAEKDHTEPAVIMDEWVPRATRALYGPEVGSRIAPIFQVGVLPLYIEKPWEGIETANWYRRQPTEESVDPGETTNGRLLADPIEDSAARMEGQVTATRLALEAIDEAYPYLHTVDPYRRQTVIDFYRRMVLWHLLAKARYASRLASEQAAAGDVATAEQTLAEGLAELEADRLRAEAVLLATADEPNLQDIGELLDWADIVDQELVLPSP